MKAMKIIKTGAIVVGVSLGLYIGGIASLILANALIYAAYIH